MEKKNLTLIPLTDKKLGRYLFCLCFVFYFVVYFGRLNYSAALAAITPSGFLAKDQAGLINTAFFVTYGCGQFFSGFLSDRMPPFGMISAGIGLAGGMNLLMYIAFKAEAGLPVYIALWAINGLVQSVIWPTMIRIVSNILPAEQRVSAGVAMLMTTAVGTVLSYLISTAVMNAADWQECFLVPGLILVIGSGVWFLLTRVISEKSVFYRKAAQTETNVRPATDKTAVPLLRLMAVSGAFFMLIPIAVMGIIKDGFTTWTPTIITELFQADPKLSTLLTTVIPLISIFGAAFSKIVMEKWLHDEMKSCVFLFGVSTVITFALMFISTANMYVTVFLLAFVIACMLGLNTLQISLVALRYGKYNRSATMTGILNSSASICCGISSYFVGLISKTYGWNIIMIIFFVLSVLGAVLSALLVPKWIAFKNM